MNSGRTTALLALPLATTFAAAVATPADAASVDYSLTVNPTLTLTHSYLFVASTSPIIDIVNLGPFTGGSSQQFSYTDNDEYAEDNRVVFLGVYDDGNATGLSVSLLDQGANTETNPSFEELFKDLYLNQPPGAAEDSVVANLVSGTVNTPNDTGEAETFVQGFAFPRFTSNGAQPHVGFGENATINLANFSNLSNGGTLSVTRIAVIPEPASLALLGVGGLLLAARRRR